MYALDPSEIKENGQILEDTSDTEKTPELGGDVGTAGIHIEMSIFSKKQPASEQFMDGGKEKKQQQVPPTRIAMGSLPHILEASAKDHPTKGAQNSAPNSLKIQINQWVLLQTGPSPFILS